VIVHYRDGQATSDTEGVGGGVYEEKLSAPRAIGSLLDAGKAAYVGVRSNAREGTKTPDLDILIFPSESEAAAQAASLSDEAGAPADHQTLFVTVPVSKKNAEAPADSAKALAGCREQALP
jgi:hypothetical protein